MDYLQTELEMKIAQLQGENNSLIQREVSDSMYTLNDLGVLI